MAQSRGKKSNPAGRAKTYQDSVKRHPPPVGLSQDEIKAFNEVVESREYDTWTVSDLNMAAKLARVSVELDRLWNLYSGGPEGFTLGQGDLDEHNKLMPIYMQLHRMLGLSASQRGLRGPKQDGRNQKQAGAKRKLASVSGLIAQPRA